MTGVNENVADATVRKINQLKELLSDPVINQVARNMLGITQHCGSVGMIGRPGSVLRKACEIVMTYDRKHPFTVKEVRDGMLKSGYSFAVKKNRMAVQAALRKMVEGGIIKLIEEGGGRRPKIFQREK